MNKKILITDSFFITDENIEKLKDARYEVVRLDIPKASEQELVEAIKDISVYILGGIEEVTDAVIASANKLKAIIFPGVDYSKFIPAEQAAKEKGIQLLNAPGANAIAVAEFMIGIAISMQRHLQAVSQKGDEKYSTTSSIEGSTIGIVGAGHVGSKVVDAISVFKPREIIYYNHSEKTIAARKVGLSELIQSSDIIFISLPMHAGMIFDSTIIQEIKKGCLIVSVSPMNIIDFNALLPRLKRGELRAAIDWPAPSPEFNALPASSWYSVNSHTAYNTYKAINNVNDKVTQVAVDLA